jgi:hypothetical protein
MKPSLFFWLSLLGIIAACQSKSPAPIETNAAAKTIPETAAVKKTLTPPKTQDSASISANEDTRTLNWTEINIDFMANCLNPFLASKRIKSDCTGCDKIMFSFSFVVDGQGKIQTALKEGENISCNGMSETDKKKLEEEILVYMKKQVLPPSFYNITYKGSLGFILKC